MRESALAVLAARELGDVEIVSADSMQVYRGMDIGTAKTPEAERGGIVHHLIDVADPADEWDVVRFITEAGRARAEIEARGRRALFVGGTGLYLHALIDGFAVPGRWPGVWHDLDEQPDTAALHRRLEELDPVGAARVEAGNRRRVRAPWRSRWAAAARSPVSAPGWTPSRPPGGAWPGYGCPATSWLGASKAVWHR